VDTDDIKDIIEVVLLTLAGGAILLPLTKKGKLEVKEI
jgi:hypothetical protein